MTISESLRDNPLYQKGVLHLQRREWTEASQCFDRLRAEYPELRDLDLPSIHARLRASVRGDHPHHRRLPLAGLRWIALLVAIIGVIAVVGLLVVRAQPGSKVVESGSQQALKSHLLSKGKFSLESEDYDEAARAFEDVLRLAPGNEEARQGLAQANFLNEQATKYNEALRFMREKRYDEARSLLLAVNESMPDYKDVKELLSLIREKTRLDNLFDEASRAYNAYNWQEAAYLFEQVKAINPNYMASYVNSGLFAAYYNQAIQILAGSSEARAKYDVALSFLEKALAVSPGDPRATQQKASILNQLAQHSS